MMDWLLLLLLAQAAAPSGATPPPVTVVSPPPVVPTDWRTLAPLPWRAEPKVTPDLSSFVTDQVRANRCGPAMLRGSAVAVEVAVQLRADGRIVSAVPRAIDCPTIEQFAAGLVTSFARNNLRAVREGWYKTTVTFAVDQR